ncbi:Na/Pi cotransporter family protein [Roseovarius sp. 2305UL8-3]|uniref:Na/Pi cotransporter family protein n=1 Tax=Roseovarius conchicola TaxID=3121636 RepID=UPI0035297E97
MAILSFLVQLFGATMLLLYSVRMVRTGIERAFGSGFRRVVTQKSNSLVSAASGLGLALVLQSSAAVALLVAGFAGAAELSFPVGLAVILGADLGSALLIQILSFPLDWLVPLLLGIGGFAFVKSERRGAKQAGRIILGIAFILISLRFLRETMDPIRDSSFLPAIAGFLARDFIAAFLVGAALAFVMHSSVAVILMCVTLVAIETVPVEAGVSLVLGANLGSGLIPVWLSRGMSPAARRPPLANMTLRGLWAFATLLFVNHVPVIPYLAVSSAGQTLVNVHLAFNLTLLVLALPFVEQLERVFTGLLPDIAEKPAKQEEEHRSALDEGVLDTPALALASLRREVLRMLHLCEGMLKPVMDVYRSGDKQHARSIIREDQNLNDALDGVRKFVANMPQDSMTDEQSELSRELVEYAIAIESAGDIVVKRLVPRAMQKSKEQVKFSKEGFGELCRLHEQVLSNVSLAANVLISDDLESARLLLEEKTECAVNERTSREKHLGRLQSGAQISFESSNIHLETLRALKDLNSQIAAVAYPILLRGGQLLETRLIESIDIDDTGKPG